MLENTRTLRVVLQLLVLSYLPVCSGWIDPSRIFLDLLTYKGSCGYGMVAQLDYFVLRGLINITNMPYGRYGQFSIYYRPVGSGKSYWIAATRYALYKKNCSDTDIIKIDSCHCTFLDADFIKFKCNVTAKTIYSRSELSLLFSTSSWFFSPSFQMPPIYASPECIEHSLSQAAKNQPESFSVLLGNTLLGTAIVCLVSSIISQA